MHVNISNYRKTFDFHAMAPQFVVNISCQQITVLMQYFWILLHCFFFAHKLHIRETELILVALRLHVCALAHCRANIFVWI